VLGEAELRPREPALLFLLRADATTHVVTDMAGGCFALRADALGVQRLVVARAAEPAAVGEPSAAALLQGKSLSEVRALLAGAIFAPGSLRD
jgi:hypothetical protein